MNIFFFYNVRHAVVSGTYPWWPAYPLPRFDQKVLSRLAEYDSMMTSSNGLPSSAFPRDPPTISNFQSK